MGIPHQSVTRRNNKHAQAVWQGMSFRKRAKPSSKGNGDFYRIVLRPKEQFTIFRTQELGRPGGLQRLAGKRSSGSWATQAWLVSKDSAHIEGKRLVADNKDVADLIKRLGSQPLLEKGDIFTAKDGPTPRIKQVQQQNIKKAPATHRK